MSIQRYTDTCTHKITDNCVQFSHYFNSTYESTYSILLSRINKNCLYRKKISMKSELTFNSSSISESFLSIARLSLFSASERNTLFWLLCAFSNKLLTSFNCSSERFNFSFNLSFSA